MMEQIMIWSPTCGIAVESNDFLVQYNSIENVGYLGVFMAPDANIVGTVKNNFINNTCLVLDDGGGIYTGAHTSILIEENIILNSIGNTDGAIDNIPMAEGIYLDESASGITVRNNTIANCSYSGIKLHKAHDNIIRDNTSYNNYAGIDFENWTSSSTIYNNTITGNIFFAKGSSQYAMIFLSPSYSILGFGTADNNYYARPVMDDDVFRIRDGTGDATKTLAQWQTYSSQDASSHKSPISIADTSLIDFYYNPTSSDSVITLPVRMIDVRGTVYPVRITLPAYGSAVLMPDPNAVGKLMRSPGGKILRSAGGKIIRH
jgi:parallel beta-helix repeat protein/predicted outer membrane repeat protein